jgi:hypothetical protein
MPGIGPAAIADDDVGFLGQEIDDLPFSFVAPLQTDDADVALQQRIHAVSPLIAGVRFKIRN